MRAQRTIITIVITDRQLRGVERCRREAAERGGLLSRSAVIRTLLSAALDAVDRGEIDPLWFGARARPASTG